MGQDTSMEDKTIGGATMKEQERESHIRRILLRRRRKFEQLREQLSDSDISSFVIVLAAERLPVLETIELQEQLQEANITVECLIVNKRAPANSGEFLDERHAQEEIHLQTLTNALPAIQRQDIYLQPQDVVGIGAVETLAQKL